MGTWWNPVRSSPERKKINTRNAQNESKSIIERKKNKQNNAMEIENKSENPLTTTRLEKK